METIQWGGETYVVLSAEIYDGLSAALDRNRRARMVGVEEFRAWCEANKGTHTMEEGLRACTSKELYQQAMRLCPVCHHALKSVVGEVADRLERREARRQRESAAARIEPISPKEDALWP